MEGGEMKNFLRILTTKEHKGEEGREKSFAAKTFSTFSTLRFFSFLPEYAGD
jgi:hypothetical protein